MINDMASKLDEVNIRLQEQVLTSKATNFASDSQR